jgi:O-Antigen ligase/Tetratricopeptide repeat
MQLPRIEHLITSAVAVACVGLGLAEGGFPPTAVAATALVVWGAVLVGLATGVFPRSEPPRAAIAAGLCLAGFAALVALSMAWASDDGGAFEDAVKALAYLGTFALVVVASPRESARAWLRGLAIGLAAVGAIALLARFEPPLFGSPDAELVETIPAIAGRLTYPVGYWNGLAAAMAATAVLLVWFATTGRSRTARALAAGTVPVIVLALWMTGSRGGIVAAAIAIAILLAAAPGRSRLVANLALGVVAGAVLIFAVEAREELLKVPYDPKAGAQGDQMLAITLVVFAATAALRYALDAPLERLRVSRRVGVAALAALAIAAVTALVIVDPIEQFDEFREPPSAEQIASGERGLFRGGGSGRWQFWETAVDAFASAPVEGVGASGFTPYWLEHREYPIVARRAHSLLFETVAELGIVGLTLVLAFFVVAAVVGVQRWRAAKLPELAPALAVLVVGFAAASVDWTWDIPAVFVPTVIAAAVLTGPATLPGPGGTATVYGEVRSRRRFARGVAVLLIAWASICASGLLLLADHELTQSRARAEEGDLAGAIEAAENAVDLEPWASEPRLQLATVYSQAGDIPAARAAIAEAIERNRNDWELYLAAATLAAQDADEGAADANLARATELNPLQVEE